MDAGLQQATGQQVSNPLPLSWLQLATSPTRLPDWAKIGSLTSNQVHALQAQIGYDLSAWNYKLVGPNNQLGRYQFSTSTLEQYGLLIAGSNTNYGTSCVNYQFCWAPSSQTKASFNSSIQYIYNTPNITTFLNSPTAQEHLNYQILNDLYLSLVKINAITPTDTADIVGGMLYVALQIGAGSAPGNNNPTGTGAYAWRYWAIGNAEQYYNSGRYAITFLAQ